MEYVKLTLRVDREIVKQGKLHAKNSGTSLSRLFDRLLKDWVSEQQQKDRPIISLEELDRLGLQEPINMTDHQIREEYARHLLSKQDKRRES